MTGRLNPLGEYKYRLIYYSSTVVIKGMYDIKSYDDNIAVVKCGKDCITVNGEKIEIKSMDSDEIQINGKISDILFS